MAETFADYPWSSGSFYFNKEKYEAIDCGYVEELFGTKDELQRFIMETNLDELPTVRSDLGQIIGGEEFIPLATAMAERVLERRALNTVAVRTSTSNRWRK